MNDLAPAEETVTPVPPEFPPVVYLPCATHTEDPADAVAELRQTRDGRMA